VELCRYSGLRYAELTNIRRQHPDGAKNQTERQWLKQHRLAVGEARDEKIARPLTGWISKEQLSPAHWRTNRKSCGTFLKLFKNQQSTVVVSQSWSEIHKVNARVRNGLKAQGLIGEQDTNPINLRFERSHFGFKKQLGIGG
jgi:hypothetical protein